MSLADITWFEPKNKTKFDSLNVLINKLAINFSSFQEVEERELDKLYRSVEIECRGLDKAVLRSYSQFINASANHLEINLEKM